MWARNASLEIRGDGFMVVYSHNISVRVAPAHIFSQTDSDVSVVCPKIDLYAVLEENHLVAFGVGFHCFCKLCGCVPLVCIVAVYKRMTTSRFLKNR